MKHLVLSLFAVLVVTSNVVSTRAYVVQMFSGPPTATQHALRVVGQEMVRDVATSRPVIDAIEGAVIPRVDNILHRTLDPYAPVVSQITHNENATEEYIKSVDEKVARAIELSMQYPELRQEIFTNLTIEVVDPIVNVTEVGVQGVRDNVVETVDTRLRTAIAPFRPVTTLMGKNEDIDTWIKAVDESLENVIQIQPLSEEAAALRNLRDTVLQPYMSRYQRTNNQIDSDIQSLDGTSAADATSKPPSESAAAANPFVRYYQRFWEVRNNITGPSLDDVLENAANTQTDSWLPASTPTTEQFESDILGVPQPYQPVPTQSMPLSSQPESSAFAPTQSNVLSSQEPTKADTKAFKAIRQRLASIFDNVPEELVTVNPRFLMKHPNWLSTTVSKVKADNPNISDKNLADTLSDMLRMMRMKRQARNLASKGCPSNTIEELLKEFWIQKKFVDFQNPPC